jgi:hypothetical protein
MFLREGIDKVFLTVREKKHTKHPYPRDVSLMYADRLVKLKFSDRYAFAISFSKYPWSQWSYQGQSKATYAVEYFLRLDGMRQLRVMLNAMRLYNIRKKLPLYKGGLLFDDNVVVPSQPFVLSEFVEMIKEIIPELKQDYVQMRKDVFNDDVHINELVVDTHQIEVVQEGIGLHTSDVSSTFRDLARCQSIKVFHEQTNTHYFNMPGRRQLKIYQKGIGILRMEATFNTHPKDIIYDWQQDTMHTVRSIQAEFDDLLEDLNLPKSWYKVHTVSRDKLLWLIANSLNIRKYMMITDKDGKEKWVKSDIIDIDLMKILLTITAWSSKRVNRNMTNMLVRKKLIKAVGRGKYIPTENLRMIQELFNKLDRMKVYEESMKDEEQ